MHDPSFASRAMGPVPPLAMSRRDLLMGAAVAGVAALGSHLEAQDQHAMTPLPRNASGEGGLLFPQQNRWRNVFDLSGLWEFQLDPETKGEADGWFRELPKPRPIAVPCSWNDLFDEARDYLDLAWYLREFDSPADWRGERVFLYVGSANYAAKVWVNGEVAAEHLGGHLPFAAEVTGHLVWDRKNTIAIAVENRQSLDRVPPGPNAGGGGVAGVLGGFPLTTYDFFPYAGLHRPVILYSVPPAAHIDDITVRTEIEGNEGLVKVKVTIAGKETGRGKIRLDDLEAELVFQGGTAETALRVPSARFWSPNDPYLYPLSVSLTEDEKVTNGPC